MEVIEEFFQKKINELNKEKEIQIKILEDALNRSGYDNLVDSISIPFCIDGTTRLTKELFEEYIEDIKKVVIWILDNRYKYENQRRLMPPHSLIVNDYLRISNQFTMYLTITWHKPKLKHYYFSQNLKSYIEILFCYQELVECQEFKDMMIDGMVYGQSHDIKHYPDEETLKRVCWNK